MTEDTLFLLQMGRCDVAHAGRTIATLGAGTVFGEMALVSERPRSATIKAEAMYLKDVGQRYTAHDIRHRPRDWDAVVPQPR